MKQEWIRKYKQILGRERDSVDVLTGFNANIDIIADLEDLDIDLEGTDSDHVEKVSGKDELKKELKHVIDNGLNEEVELEYEPSIKGENRLGGQAGIMSNFLCQQQNGVIFYTPFLSEELAQKMYERILTPVMDGKFVLKNVRDSVSADRTKKNLIIEYDNDTTGRAIFSRKMQGFGPYFRKGIEDNFDDLENNIDRAIFSGYHDVEGNMETKLKKAKKQLQKFNTAVHLEYVHRQETADLIIDNIFPYVNSLGLDEGECRKIAGKLGIDVSEDLSLGEVFHVSRELIKDKQDLERVHVHTYRYHVTVCKQDYSIDEERIQEAMLYGELAAIISADIGELPSPEDFDRFNFEEIHLHRLDDLEHFGDFFDIHDFARNGKANVEGMRVVAIPTLIHEDPKRLVGLGDIISSGAFVGELQ
jgi:ADP-dependent phosphofructokinase/glucokinase